MDEDTLNAIARLRSEMRNLIDPIHNILKEVGVDLKIAHQRIDNVQNELDKLRSMLEARGKV